MAFMATYDEEATDPVIEAPATPVFEADSRSGSRLAVSPEREKNKSILSFSFCLSQSLPQSRFYFCFNIFFLGNF
jgi:hypothetical protein